MSDKTQAIANFTIATMWLLFVILWPSSSWLKLWFCWGSGFLFALGIANLNRLFYWSRQ